jgi:hypothetical protein
MLRITISCSLWRAASSPTWRSASVSCGISLAVEQRPPERHRRRARAGKDGRRAEITGPQVTHSTVTIAAVAPMSGGASFRKRTPQAPAPFAMAGLQLSLIQGVLDDRVSGNSKEHHRIEQSTCPVKGSAGRSSMSITTDHSYRLDPTEQPTGVSWGAIAAGAVVAAALSFALIALGVGLGLSAIFRGRVREPQRRHSKLEVASTLPSSRYWPLQWEDTWRRACAPGGQRLIPTKFSLETRPTV